MWRGAGHDRGGCAGVLELGAHPREGGQVAGQVRQAGHDHQSLPALWVIVRPVVEAEDI